MLHETKQMRRLTEAMFSQAGVARACAVINGSPSGKGEWLGVGSLPRKHEQEVEVDCSVP